MSSEQAGEKFGRIQEIILRGGGGRGVISVKNSAKLIPARSEMLMKIMVSGKRNK